MLNVCIIDNGIATFKKETLNSLNRQDCKDFIISELDIRDLHEIHKVNFVYEYVLFLYGGSKLTENAINEITKIIDDINPDWCCFSDNNENQQLLDTLTKLLKYDVCSCNAILVKSKLIKDIRLNYDGYKYYIYTIELQTQLERIEHGHFVNNNLIQSNYSKKLTSDDEIYVRSILKSLGKHILNYPEKYYMYSVNQEKIEQIKKEKISIILLDECEKDSCFGFYNYEIICCKDKKSYFEKCLYGIFRATGDYLIFIKGRFEIDDLESIYDSLYLSSLDGIGAVSPVIVYNGKIQYSGIFSLFGKQIEIDESALNYFEKDELHSNRETVCVSSYFWIIKKEKALLMEDMENEHNCSDGTFMYKFSDMLSRKGLKSIVTGKVIANSKQPIIEKQYGDFFGLLEKRKYNFVYDKKVKGDLSVWLDKNIINGRKVFLPNNFELKKNRKIFVLSHELSLTGAPIVLLEAIKIMIKNDFQVVVGTLVDGPLKKNILDLGIPVISFNENTDDVDWDSFLDNFDISFVNTVIPFKEIEKMEKTNNPIIWWLHDAKQVYDEGFKHLLPEKHGKNVRIFAVSEYAKMACLKYRPNYSIDVFPYGIKDISDSVILDNPYMTDKKVFLCIGTIEWRKGQDVLLNAIDLLPDSIRNNCLFVFVGKRITYDVTGLYEKLIDVKNNYEERIEYIEKIPHDEMISYIKYAHAVICPSKDDPLPTVMSETMMLSNVCICSENTGTASLIKNHENGYLYRNNNPLDLAECIIDCYNNKDNSVMKVKARETYLNNFSLDVFEERLLDILK